MTQTEAGIDATAGGSRPPRDHPAGHRGGVTDMRTLILIALALGLQACVTAEQTVDGHIVTMDDVRTLERSVLATVRECSRHDPKCDELYRRP